MLILPREIIKVIKPFAQVCSLQFGVAFAWYAKTEPTFSDAIALVRRHLWTRSNFTNSSSDTGLVEIPASVLHGLVDSLCYTA
jgi:hypothetical protein